MKKKRVLLLDGQTVQAIAIAKFLHELGYEAVSFCDDKMSYGFRTKYVKEKILSPSLNKHPEEYLEFLIHYLKQNEIDVLFPLNDDSATLLSKFKEKLSPYAGFLIPDWEVFDRGYDKNQLMALCQKHHFPHPQTIDLSHDQPVDGMQGFKYPALIKPNKTTGGRGITLVNSYEEFQERVSGVLKEFGDSHLQEFIPSGGRQFKVQLFVGRDQALVNATVIHKIRFYPENGGSSCCNQSIESPELVEVCHNVLKELKWVGFADFDLIEDRRDGQVKIMEINPRVPACIKSSLVSGVDFVQNIVAESLGGTAKKYTYNPGKYLRYFGLDSLWMLYSKNRFSSKPSWFHFFGRDVFYQEGSLSDPMPFIYGTIGGFLKQLNPSFRKQKSGMR
ncbi:ATP-grasp domain-containing protein [Echinicola sp. 20G]|uniref:carboxylate--amine ligase n=1 Tax=Echinicola sp. 20G TaxID=2781961 RepID=UPI001910C348|nr:ATP-grasp domain-containing protein [Echinicola sp. 20G]